MRRERPIGPPTSPTEPRHNAPEAESGRAWQRRLFDRLGASAYDFFVEHERLGRGGSQVLWGADLRPLYDGVRQALAALPSGTRVLDVPCGGGLAFRGLSPSQRVAYVAADLSPGMLSRARRQARRRSLTQIDFVKADVTRLPFDDASFDLCLSYNGLHCFPAPDTTLTEMARCLRQGGRLLGTSTIRGAGARYDRLIAAYRRAGIFATVPTAEDLENWLPACGFREHRLERSGALVYFDGRRA